MGSTTLVICISVLFSVCSGKMRLPPIGMFKDEFNDVPASYGNDVLEAPASNRTSFSRGSMRGTDLVVDTLVLLDYGLFKAFSETFQDVPESKRRAAVADYLKEYYGLTFAAIAQRYENADLKIDGKDGRIRLRLAALRMATTPGEDQWSEPHAETFHSSSRKKILDSVLLHGVADWFQEEQESGKYKNIDHVMVFTGNDITMIGRDHETGEHGVEVRYSVGATYKGQICDRLTVSITEEDMQFKAVSTAAHEAAHNLGADHDGEGEGASCSAADEYLMNAGVTNGDEKTFQNQYKFSVCSKNSFREKMEELNKLGINCLADTGKQDPEMKKISDVIPGFKFDLHQQCQIFTHSKESFYCGQNANEAMSDICRKPACWNPRGKFCGNFLGNNHVLPGTPCGADKWCMNGACVPAERKIHVNANGCVLEDSPKCDDYTRRQCEYWPKACCNKCKILLKKGK